MILLYGAVNSTGAMYCLGQYCLPDYSLPYYCNICSYARQLVDQAFYWFFFIASFFSVKKLMRAQYVLCFVILIQGALNSLISSCTVVLYAQYQYCCRWVFVESCHSSTMLFLGCFCFGLLLNQETYVLLICLRGSIFVSWKFVAAVSGIRSV